MLCTLRPVSNLLSLALRLTEHLHNLAVPKNRDTETYPPYLPSPYLTLTPSPSSVSHGSRNTETPRLFPSLFCLPSSLFSPFLCISLFLSLPHSKSPTETQLTHPPTHIHTNTHSYTHPYPSVCLVNFHSGLFLKDSISIKAVVALRRCLYYYMSAHSRPGSQAFL